MQIASLLPLLSSTAVYQLLTTVVLFSMYIDKKQIM